MSDADICFLATSKSGLGHLRRSATIGLRLRSLAPERKLHLISNARPEEVKDDEVQAFDTVQVLEPDRMAQAVARTGAGVLVLDTITVPGIEKLGLPLALVLRETPDHQLYRFRLAERKQWDLVVVANPQEYWMPRSAALAAVSVVPAGWIYRPTGRRKGACGAVPTVLVAKGGGGTAETARSLYAEIYAVLSLARHRGPAFDVVQAIGPRAQTFGQLAQADRKVDPGAALNDLFREADIVISTAGYNSVLELATADTPTLLVPVPRSIDDRTTRARSWAQKLGMWLDPASPEGGQVVDSGNHRPPPTPATRPWPKWRGQGRASDPGTGMSSSANSAAASWFEKHYPSVSAADFAMERSLVARMAGVPTPAVLGRDGPLRRSFERVVAGFPPTLSEMVEVLRWMKRMPPDGMIRFDPFLRIRPRLDRASPHICALVFELEAQDASIRWSQSTVIHGYFHPGQTIRDHAGKIWLLDLDDLALAPPEADLGNLAAWVATRSEGNLNALADAALTELLALSPRADPALTGHFFQVALVRRALKLAEKGLPWAVDQLPLRD